MDFTARLTNMADSLPLLKHIQRLPGDQYVLASGLQKAIRRGDAKRAGAFAMSLGYADRRMLWRRLLIIAFEDIGPANPQLIIDVIAASKSCAWRRQIGDARVAVYLAREMAGSVKSRFVTEALFLTDLGQEAASLRKRLPKLSNRVLTTITLDQDNSPCERLYALWALAGTKLYAAKGFSRIGSLDEVTKAISKLPCDPELAKACLFVLKDMRWPLALFLPLAMGLVGLEHVISRETPISAPEMEGVPTWAIDPLYTRLGQTAMRQLQREVSVLKGYSLTQLGETAFFIEGENMDQRLTSDSLAEFRRRSIDVFMADLGLCDEAGMSLNRTLVKHWDMFNDLRLRQIERSLYGAITPDLFTQKKEG